MSAQARDERGDGTPATAAACSGAGAAATATMIAQAKASCSSAPPTSARDVMEISSDDDLFVGDPFVMAFAAPPRQEESTIPWRGPEQHFIGDAPTQMETTQQASAADQHAAALDAINLGVVNPFVPVVGRGVLEHPEAPPAVKAKSAPPPNLRIDDEIWEQAIQMEDAVGQSLPPARRDEASAGPAATQHGAAQGSGTSLPPTARQGPQEQSAAQTARTSLPPMARQGSQESAEACPQGPPQQPSPSARSGPTAPTGPSKAAPGTPVRQLLRGMPPACLGPVATTPPTSTHPAAPPTPPRRPSRKDNFDKMDEIIAMIQHSSLENKHNLQSVHERLDARDAAIDERFNTIEKMQKK